ncbi:Protein of unknown function [Pseudobutyrivibrio sp. 49]|uniref:DUF975 family protein n=1 Tax=unclassified Pseudobutyrivibrio TaxID=2638619 RepID=UPI0008887130|nr:MULTISPECIES: DUF975 family protein [unclassified Pseudobutyrivibrio]SDH98395.1 Protein of unknown function [Pseudobutyrivibrio sp. 49]SFN88117.1 Protein of unknown function [Pseudobutyrivibrio sp. UC1225]
MFPRKQIKANARAALSANYWPVVGYPFLLGLLLVIVLSIVSAKSIMSMAGAAGTSSLTTAEAALTASMGTTVATDTVTILLSIFVLNVIAVGQVYFYYKFYSGSRADFSTFFDGFKNGQYWHNVGGMFLMTLYVCLWTMLFCLPGAILVGLGAGFLFVDSGVGVLLLVLGVILYIVGIVFAFVKAYQYSMIPYLLIDKPEFTVKECFEMTKKMTKGNKWSLFVLDLSFIGWIILSMFTLFILAIFYVEPYMNLAKAGAYDYLKRVHMPESVEGPTFQSASFEADYTSSAPTFENTDTLNNTPSSNDDIFDE